MLLSRWGRRFRLPSLFFRLRQAEPPAPPAPILCWTWRLGTKINDLISVITPPREGGVTT
jgi:hypothetical protein